MMWNGTLLDTLSVALKHLSQSNEKLLNSIMRKNNEKKNNTQKKNAPDNIWYINSIVVLLSLTFGINDST